MWSSCTVPACGVDGCKDFGKDVIVFQRHRSGPVYLQYEIVSPRFLRQHTDKLALRHIAFEDVVTDNPHELTWRLRALCGLKNTRRHQDPVHRWAGCLGAARGSRAGTGQEDLESRSRRRSAMRTSTR